MKTLIEKLANGNVEYSLPEAQASVEQIQLKVFEGEKVHSEFSIDTTNDKDIKGVVSSTDARVEVLNAQFFGKHNLIKLLVDAEQLPAGTVIENDIIITSNSGAISIPCRVDVQSVTLETSVGTISGIEDFMKLWTYDYEEALRLFLSKSFKSVLLKNDAYMCTLYDQMLKNMNREIAMEEFLVAMKMKNKVEISVINSKAEYENITEAYGDEFQITRSCMGYVDIDVETEGEFLHNCKEKITNDDFVGNTFSYQYLISQYKLHQGENRGKIILKTATQTLEYEIIINNTPDDIAAELDYERKIFEMMNSYVDFRCGKIVGQKWIDDMTSHADSMLAANDNDMTAILLKTQVTILSGDTDKASTMLARLSQMVNSIDSDKVEYYCYYLYLKTIFKKKDSYTDDIKREIKSYFENGYDKWGLLWMIFYLDERYSQNPSLKYTLIKEQFNKGCTSPVMYYEAVMVLNAEPALLRIINSFEIQILNFGAKRGIINDKLVRQIMLLLAKDNNCSPIMLRTLMKIYENNNSDEVLEGICRMLINGNKRDSRYFKWFDRGVQAGVKLAELMESYVYGVANQGYIKLRQPVYMYFGYSTESLGDYQAYLFANVIKNKGSIPEVYKEYRGMMKKYAISNLAGGHINNDLAVIYQEVFTKDYEMSEELEKMVPAIVNAYRISVDNDNIVEVSVNHKETNDSTTTTMKHGRAIVYIYTDEPIIVFTDNKGRKLANLKYKMTPMIDIPHLSQAAESLDNKYMEIINVNRCINAPTKHKGMSETLIKVWENDAITEYYRNNLSTFIVKYCEKNYDAAEMTDFLMKIDADKLCYEDRIKLIEILIKRGYFNQVTPYIIKYGFWSVNKDDLLDYLVATIKNGDFQEDSRVLEMARYLFINDKYSAVTLGYLQKYYSGPTDEMYNMWKACVEVQVTRDVFEERIIVQMIFEGRCEERLFEVFDSYFQREIGRNLRKAYYTYICYKYFVDNKDPDDKFFEYFEQDYKAGIKMSEISKMSYLSFLSKKSELSKEQLENSKSIIYELTELNIVFEYYKKFNKWFKMPYSIMDKTIIDYRTSPKNKVFIMYSIYDEKGELTKSATEEMSSVFPGVFAKQLTMFYGEKVSYTIVDRQADNIEHTDEQIISLTDTEIYNDENKFGQINGMLISAKVGREDALEELMKNYEFNKKVSEDLFTLL